jgi:hypothetical protein
LRLAVYEKSFSLTGKSASTVATITEGAGLPGEGNIYANPVVWLERHVKHGRKLWAVEDTASCREFFLDIRWRRIGHLSRPAGLYDSPLEEAVRSELVSEGQFSLLAGKIQGNSSILVSDIRIPRRKYD